MNDAATFSDPSKAAEAEPGDAEQKAEQELSNWLQEIEASRKRERNFLKLGHKIEKLYECEKAATAEDDSAVDSPGPKVQFNILYSNTETLAPAMYNSTPV